jgi:putative transposase
MRVRRRIVDDQLYAHFITFSVFRRRRLLDHDHPKRILLGVLNGELQQQEASCAGFVLLPDHVHAIVWFSTTGGLSQLMHGWKRESSFQIRAWYRQAAARYFERLGEGDRFWQPKYYSVEIHGRAKLEEKLQYMHDKPIGQDRRPIYCAGCPCSDGSRSRRRRGYSDRSLAVRRWD